MASDTQKKAKASQEFVPLKEVRDGVIVLQDDTLRAIYMTSSLNMALKSADEQEAILRQFQNFLNSLDFSVQFFIQSRELDIRPYLNLLEKRYTEQTSELMKIQVREYIEFIKTFTEGANIMSKSFYVVIPYNPSMLDNGIAGNIRSMMPIGSRGGAEAKAKNQSFEEARTQLEQRVTVVSQGLSRCGIRIAPLGTEEVIELFYKLFNLGELEHPMAIAK
jgi:hypothetical protein